MGGHGARNREGDGQTQNIVSRNEKEPESYSSGRSKFS